MGEWGITSTATTRQISGVGSITALQYEKLEVRILQLTVTRLVASSVLLFGVVLVSPRSHFGSCGKHAFPCRVPPASAIFYRLGLTDRHG